MAASPRNTFLSNLATWAYDIPYSAQWAMQIDTDVPTSTFMTTLQQYTRVDLDDGFFVDDSIINKLLNTSVAGQQDGLGLHFAQSITVPQDGFTPGAAGVEESGGYIKGVIGGSRMGVSEKTITTELLETNLDFVDGILRPWMIAASYRGLIERSDLTSVKCTLYITQYTKGPNRPIRKIHHFYGCVPFDISSSTLDYEAEKLTKRSVKWLYNHYRYLLVDNV